MVGSLVWFAKALILTEALTHAVRSWGILDDVRSSITRRFSFLAKLLACFECTSVWIAAFVLAYLYFLDFWPFTFIIIFQRLATIAHIVIDLVDGSRAGIVKNL